MQEEKIKKLVPYVRTSLHLCKESLNELLYISQTARTDEEIGIVLSRPFNFYGVALQYCFIMEYTKLLEQKAIGENNNVASLYKLNNSTNKYLGNEFDAMYSENKKLLKELTKSNLFNKLRKLRNKKFGHAENHEINDPLKIKGFVGSELEEMAKQLNTLLKIANSCFGAIGCHEIIIVSDKGTRNFIKYHAVYKKYYHDNFQRAYSEGYQLNKHVEVRTEP